MVFNAYSPVAGGFLLGNYTAEGHQTGQRFASEQGPYTKWYNTSALHSAVDKLRSISERSAIGMGELSLRWLAHHSALGEGDGIIVGGSKVGHIERSAEQIMKGPLEESVAKELNALFEGSEEVKKDVAKIVDFSKKD